MKYLLAILLAVFAWHLKAQDSSPFPVRAFCIGAPRASQVDQFIKFIKEELPPKSVNTLVLEVDYNFQFTTHPEVGNSNGLSKADAQKILAACRQNHIQLIPLMDLLGHQSWANHLGNLLKAHPEFDETPWVKMPEKYVWPNSDGLYCKSYCPLQPQVHEVIFDLVDELCDAFEAKVFHAGMDEVFYIGADQCPRCGGKDKAELFAGEVKRIHDHLKTKGRQMWMWGDRLLDRQTTGINEWEASRIGTSRAIDLIPKDIVICDWHYDHAEPTAVYFALKGFPVITCVWKNPEIAREQTQDILRAREQSNAVMKLRLLGIAQTIWSGAGSFMNEYYKFKADPNYKADEKTEAKCFTKTFTEIAALNHSSPAPVQKTN
jgi:hypothetical protein